MSEERLQKLLAQAGIASRRRAEELILAGRVRVDGQTVQELGFKIDPESSSITFDGKPVQFEKKIYLLLNKPTGYITTLSDPQGRRAVTDLIRDIPERLFPVGRLDFDTEGALIMTNDGDFANSILHPSREIKKTYEALVQGVPNRQTLQRLAQGVLIDGHLTYPAQLQILKQGKDRTLIEIIIHEGKKRQVRKMFQTVMHRVIHLRRTAYGKLRLGALPLGQYRPLSPQDRKQIFT